MNRLRMRFNAHDDGRQTEMRDRKGKSHEVRESKGRVTNWLAA